MYADWASLNIVGFASDNSAIPLSESEASWIVSLMSIGEVVGVVVSTISIEFFGSKKTVLATSPNTSISWLCVIIANSVGWLYATRRKYIYTQIPHDLFDPLYQTRNTKSGRCARRTVSYLIFHLQISHFPTTHIKENQCRRNLSLRQNRMTNTSHSDLTHVYIYTQKGKNHLPPPSGKEGFNGRTRALRYVFALACKRAQRRAQIEQPVFINRVLARPPPHSPPSPA